MGSLNKRLDGQMRGLLVDGILFAGFRGQPPGQLARDRVRDQAGAVLAHEGGLTAGVVDGRGGYVEMGCDGVSSGRRDVYL